MDEREYDVVVIGAGAVGENVADRTAQAGLATVIVEAELVGGECTFWACMPSKALLRPGAALRAARAVGGAREAVRGRLDPSGVFARRDRIVHEHDDSSQVRWVEKTGIDLVRGRGRLDGPRRVRVADAEGVEHTLVARHAVVVAVGSRPALPPILGLAQARPWTSREATSASHVPGRLAILGGGVVATEMAVAWNDLGSTVTMLVRGGLLSHEEPFAGELVGDALRDRGVEICSGVELTRVARATHGTLRLDLSDGTAREADELLVATGREPRTSMLGLESVGLEPGWLDVDETLRVRGTEWLYAAGDVTHRALLTHQGKYQARAAGDAIAARALGAPLDDRPWGRHVATADHAAVPQVTFTDPEVASVGRTAARAEADGIRTRVVDYDLSWLAGATTLDDDYTGRARAVIDADRGVLIGATFVGAGVAELVQSATIAIVGEVPLHRLWHAVPAYPTLSEVWLRLLEELGRETAESPG